MGRQGVRAARTLHFAGRMRATSMPHVYHAMQLPYSEHDVSIAHAHCALTCPCTHMITSEKT